MSVKLAVDTGKRNQKKMKLIRRCFQWQYFEEFSRINNVIFKHEKSDFF